MFFDQLKMFAAHRRAQSDSTRQQRKNDSNQKSNSERENKLRGELV